jgi:hypothetical protein
MKIEYLAEGSPDCPLIRLFSYTATELEQLRHAFQALATGLLQRVSLERILPVENPGGILLEFVLSDRDIGIVKRSQQTFAMELPSEGWITVAELAESVSETGSAGHQWLTPAGRIKLLLSPDGSW